jgi:hypothetical protein
MTPVTTLASQKRGSDPYGMKVQFCPKNPVTTVRTREDGREAGQNLHHLVQPGRGGREVGVNHVRAELAERVELVGHAKDVVVNVLEVRALADLSQVAGVAAHKDLKHVALQRDGLTELQQISFDEEELAERCVRAVQVRAGLL